MILSRGLDEREVGKGLLKVAEVSTGVDVELLGEQPARWPTRREESRLSYVSSCRRLMSYRGGVVHIRSNDRNATREETSSGPDRTVLPFGDQLDHFAVHAKRLRLRSGIG